MKKSLLLPIIIFTAFVNCMQVPTMDTYLIKDDYFAIKEGCESRGIFRIRMKKGKLQIAAEDKIYFTVEDPTEMKIWCHGAIHEWVGKVKYGYYTFISDKKSPLRFMVDKDIGYYYLGGKGKIITPEGKKINLRLKEEEISEYRRPEKKGVEKF